MLFTRPTGANHANVVPVFVLVAAFLVLVPFTAWADSWRSFAYPDGKDGVFEPSAIRQLPDGRIFLVQDEASTPFGTFNLSANGDALAYSTRTPAGAKRPSGKVWTTRSLPRLEDLEGLAMDGAGVLFATTSFSRTRSGKQRKSRKRLVRLRFDNDRISEFGVYSGLLDDILAAYPELAKSARSDFAKGRLGLNIEGLCFDRTGQKLFIGLRGPVVSKRTLILTLENPNGIFLGQTPRFAPEMIRLDMNDQGIRAMSFVPAIDAYILAAQKADKKGASDRSFHLWIWDGKKDSPAHGLPVPGLDLKKTEGITQIRHKGRDYLLLVSDDGDRSKGLPASYLIVPVGMIRSLLPGP